MQRGLAVLPPAHFVEHLQGVQKPPFLAESVHPHAVRHSVRDESAQHGVMVEQVQRLGVAGLLEPEQQRVECAGVGRVGVAVPVEQSARLGDAATGAEDAEQRVQLAPRRWRRTRSS